MALSLKLVYFFVERAAEPVSQRLENAAQASPAFRAVCRRVATSFEHIEHQKAIRRLAFEQRAAELHGVHAEPGRAQGIPADEIESPPTLTESEAVQKGAELLGEFFVLGVDRLLIHQQMRDRADEAENEAKVEKNESKIKTWKLRTPDCRSASNLSSVSCGMLKRSSRWRQPSLRHCAVSLWGLGDVDRRRGVCCVCTVPVYYVCVVSSEMP